MKLNGKFRISRPVNPIWFCYFIFFCISTCTTFCNYSQFSQNSNECKTTDKIFEKNHSKGIFHFTIIWLPLTSGWPEIDRKLNIVKENFWYWDLGRYFPIFSVFINSDKWCSTRFYFKYCNEVGFSSYILIWWRSGQSIRLKIINLSALEFEN